MKDLIKKHKEIESRRNVIAGKSSEAREKLRALKADDERHELAIKEIEKEKQNTLYADLGGLHKKIETHKAAQEKLEDAIGDAEYAFSVCKRQLNQVDGELTGIKRPMFQAVADDLIKSVSLDTKTHLLEIYAAVQLSGLRPSPQSIFDALFNKGWNHRSMRDVEAGIMKKYSL